MKNSLSVKLLCLSLVSGCSAPPMVMEHGQGVYTIFGEAEFDYNGMVNDLYAKANKQCSSQLKNIEVINTKTGYGSTGAFGSKRGYQLFFRCK